MRTLQQVQQLFPSSTIETGLAKEAIAQSRQSHGSNALTLKTLVPGQRPGGPATP